ncbi:hypothetical protein [[Mycobacterium] burgundiense]|uniref:Pyridine nucleotide-disulfide oxidoreductase n=1 Tax=[Mycobacterium] burgundiense TaxID=3064286 RepID=A0ABM9LWS1_9MYCO|nr:hypothetical protein [Mycolicibacterium sp. MU0053]CAJ1506053.1 hypothetical protein MU0053_003093 [Mycolicibacterium sp. MU0053]
MTISPTDVRRLLAAPDTDALLVLIEGRTEVIPAAALDSDEFRGALTVTSRTELIDRVGSADPTEHEVSEQAASLDAEIANLGA